MRFHLRLPSGRVTVGAGPVSVSGSGAGCIFVVFWVSLVAAALAVVGVVTAAILIVSLLFVIGSKVSSNRRSVGRTIAVAFEVIAAATLAVALPITAAAFISAGIRGGAPASPYWWVSIPLLMPWPLVLQWLWNLHRRWPRGLLGPGGPVEQWERARRRG